MLTLDLVFPQLSFSQTISAWKHFLVGFTSEFSALRHHLLKTIFSTPPAISSR